MYFPPGVEMFAVQASKSGDRPLFIEVSARFESKFVAAEVASQFPKSMLMKVQQCIDSKDQTVLWNSVTMTVNLQPSKGNDRNEGGIKRYRSFRKHAAKNGFSVEFIQPNVRGWMTEDEFEAAIS